MELKNINNLANKLYNDIEKRGIEAVKELFSEGKILSKQVRYDKSEEYIKKMIISQMDIDKMLLTHKYMNVEFDEIPKFRGESANLIEKINNDSRLIFSNNTIEELFGNTLEIESYEEYKGWKQFIFQDTHNGGKDLNTIFEEEQFKYLYDKEKNPFLKFIKSFKQKKLTKRNELEDVYSKKIRKIIQKELNKNENSYTSYNKCRNTLEKGVLEYENLKTAENIAKVTLTSLTQQEKIINIKETCDKYRNEIQENKATQKIDTEYRKKQVTLGSENGINKQSVIKTIPFQDIPRAMEGIQKEYEKAYNKSQSTEDYIKDICKIYMDFMYIQPYEDGNKRTATSLFNSMLLSKGIIPPPISLANDENIVEAFNKANSHDYTMLQDIVIQKYNKQITNNDNEKTNSIIHENNKIISIEKDEL